MVAAKEIEHFSHAHPLREMEIEVEQYFKCSLCHKFIWGPQRSYGCRVRECKEEFVIHKSCAELPKQIQHPFHPLHPLTLSSGRSYSCNGCKYSWSGFGYRCAECAFHLDVGCASLVPTLSYEGHDHLLAFFDLNLNRSRVPHFWHKNCNHCSTRLLAQKIAINSDNSVFRCAACDFNVHVFCAGFPRHIQQHPFHPQHSLSLSPKPISKSSLWQFRTSDYCDACGKSCTGSVYTCEACAFNLHLRCSKLVPIISYKHHEHLLTLFDDESDSARLCYCCGKDGTTSFCRCVQCDFNVHKSCTQLPREIRHPFHGLHPLTLGDCPDPGKCDFCHRLGIRHLALKPKEAFVCVECNFILHIPCYHSLPLTIDHKCHVCPLALKDSFVEEDNDDSDEYYCDVCETQRDPESPVYFCTECEFVAHLNCVIPKEVLSLPTFQQKIIKTTAEEAENKLSATWEDYTSHRAFERGKFQVGDVANAAISKIGEEIARLWAGIEPTLKKLKNLESDRAALIKDFTLEVKSN